MEETINEDNLDGISTQRQTQIDQRLRSCTGLTSKRIPRVVSADDDWRRRRRATVRFSRRDRERARYSSRLSPVWNAQLHYRAPKLALSLYASKYSVKATHRITGTYLQVPLPSSENQKTKSPPLRLQQPSSSLSASSLCLGWYSAICIFSTSNYNQYKNILQRLLLLPPVQK